MKETQILDKTKGGLRRFARALPAPAALFLAAALIALSGTVRATDIYNFAPGMNGVTGYYPGPDNGQYNEGVEGFTPYVSGSWSGFLDPYSDGNLYFGNDTRYTLTADPGATVTLVGFSFGVYSGSPLSSFTILDHNGNTLASVTNVGPTGSMADFSWPTLADSELTVVFGTTQTDYTWINNITFSQQVSPAVIQTFGPDAFIDQGLKTIAWTVPHGTDLATLKPAITITSGTCVPASGASPVLDVNNRATYTVTDAGVATNVYTLTVWVAPQETTLIWNTGSGAWDLVATNWIGQLSGSPVPFWNGVNVLFTNTAGGTIGISPNMQPLSTTVSATSGNYTFSGGPIAGTGSLTKAGSGTLTLAGANTYSGDTAVNGGTLVANGSGALGNSTNFTVAGGATLLLSGSGPWPAKAATLTGAGTVSMSLSGGVNVGLNFDMSAFTGILDITNGMVAVNPYYSPSFISPTNGTIEIQDNTTLYLGWTGFRLNTTVKLEGGTDNGEGYGVLRGDTAMLDGAVILGTNSTIGCAGGTFTINAVISDGGNGFGFATVKNGKFILTATNTYSGPTIVSAGTLQCDNPGALGNGGALSINTSKVNLNYIGDHIVAALTLDGTVYPPGIYGSSSSSATFPYDEWFDVAGTGTVTVLPPRPQITALSILTGKPVFTFTTVVGKKYRLRYTDDVATALSGWLPVLTVSPAGDAGGYVMASDLSLTLTDTAPMTGVAKRFYLIEEAP